MSRLQGVLDTLRGRLTDERTRVSRSLDGSAGLYLEGLVGQIEGFDSAMAILAEMYPDARESGEGQDRG